MEVPLLSILLNSSFLFLHKNPSHFVIYFFFCVYVSLIFSPHPPSFPSEIWSHIRFHGAFHAQLFFSFFFFSQCLLSYDNRVNSHLVPDTSLFHFFYFWVTEYKRQSFIIFHHFIFVKKQRLCVVIQMMRLVMWKAHKNLRRPCAWIMALSRCLDQISKWWIGFSIPDK